MSTPMIGVCASEAYVDPVEWAREKQASREQDQLDLASGTKTRAQLRRENAAFPISPPDWSSMPRW
jgi:hypothetical protein